MKIRTASIVPFATALLLAWSWPGWAQQPQTDDESALRVYLDPSTGRLVDTPPPGVIPVPLDRETLYHLSTSGVGLVPQRRPDGGLMIDLEGRFRQGSAATLDKDGSLELHRFGGEVFLSPIGREVRERLAKDSGESP